MKRFPSIRKNSEYRDIYNSGNSRATGIIVMYIKDNGLDHNRLGISAGKKIGNSVVRHTFARKIREIFRLNNLNTVQGKDIIIVARKAAASASYDRLNRHYVRLLEDHGMSV